MSAEHDSDRFVVAHFSDLHCGDSRYDERLFDFVIDQINDLSPDLVLAVGRVRVVYQGQVIAEQAAPEGFERLRPRNSRGLTEAGQLPVATLKKRCASCGQRKDGLRQAG